MHSKIVQIENKSYYCNDVSKQGIKCRVIRIQNSQDFICKVLYIYIPLSIESSNSSSISDQWYGDATYFFGISEKYHIYRRVEPGGVSDILRDSIFLKCHSNKEYHIDWEV